MTTANAGAETGREAPAGSAPARPAWRRSAPSGSTRLLGAAVLCVVALGLAWDFDPGTGGYLSPGILVPNGYVSPVTGDYTVGPLQYLPGYYIPGSSGSEIHGFESDERVVLVPAALTLAWAARRRTHATRRATRIATAGLAPLALMAFSRSMLGAALVTAAAVVLAAPVAWPDLLRRRVGSTATRRPRSSTLSPSPESRSPF